MTGSKLGRWMVAACVSAVLIGSNLGCNPAATSPSSSNPPPKKEPDKKSDPAKQPKADPG